MSRTEPIWPLLRTGARRAACAAVAFMLVAAAGCSQSQVAEQPGQEMEPTPEFSQEEVTREVSAILDGISAAVAEGDIEALSQYYARDVTIIDRNGVTRGWDSYRQESLPAGLESVAGGRGPGYLFGGPTVGGVQGNTAWAFYPYSLEVRTPEGTREIFGYGTMVLRYDGADWKIAHIQSAGRDRQPGDPTF